MRSVLLVALLLPALVTPGCAWLGGGGVVGSHATEYLTKTGALRLDVHAVSGSEPNGQALDVLKSTLRTVTGRDVQATVTSDLPARGRTYAYGPDELVRLADAHRDAPGGIGQDVMLVLYLDGAISDGRSTNIVGLAFNGVNMAIAKGKLREVACAPDEEVLGRCLDARPREVNVERAVLVHEAGHLLGLVNAGIPMQRAHEDPSSPGHSRFSDSVMYKDVETANGLANLFSGGSQIPHQFDAYDREDLAAVRGGG